MKKRNVLIGLLCVVVGCWGLYFVLRPPQQTVPPIVQDQPVPQPTPVASQGKVIHNEVVDLGPDKWSGAFDLNSGKGYLYGIRYQALTGARNKLWVRNTADHNEIYTITNGTHLKTDGYPMEGMDFASDGPMKLLVLSLIHI